MNEIQWLVDMILNYKLPAPVRDRFIQRIGEITKSLSVPTIVIPPSESVFSNPSNK